LPNIGAIAVSTTATMKTNKMNHQNSGREAVPLKSAYLLKHTRIDS
jgi:hypothetical protein